MKHLSKRIRNLIWVSLITALAVCLGCVFAACTKAQAESAEQELSSETATADAPSEFPEAAEENYSRWLSDHYSARVFTREMWLNDLMDALGMESDSESRGVFSDAFENGIVDSDAAEPYTALTRRYVAQTLTRALGYKDRKADTAADLTAADKEMNTLVYYGWFLPDEEGMVYPDAPVAEEEYRRLLDEVRRYSRLKGKTVLSFGDSIMFGMGNHDAGIADMTAEKYGMTAVDYSVSGATFGYSKGRSHIANQIKSAAKNGIKPDIIFLDGGTNDAAFVTRGEMIGDRDAKKMNERTYAGGFEYAAYLLNRYWEGVPVIYVRAHNMAASDEKTEKNYGELALTIAEKWMMNIVDVYSDTDLNTEKEAVRDAFTAYKARLGHSDGIHPTALGYAQFYLPLVAEKMDAIFE